MVITIVSHWIACHTNKDGFVCEITQGISSCEHASSVYSTGCFPPPHSTHRVTILWITELNRMDTRTELYMLWNDQLSRSRRTVWSPEGTFCVNSFEMNAVQGRIVRQSPSWLTYCQGGIKSASLVQLSPEWSTGVPEWVTTSAVQPTFWARDTCSYTCHGRQLSSNTCDLDGGTVKDVVGQPSPDVFTSSILGECARQKDWDFVFVKTESANYRQRTPRHHCHCTLLFTIIFVIGERTLRWTFDFWCLCVKFHFFVNVDTDGTLTMSVIWVIWWGVYMFGTFLPNILGSWCECHIISKCLTVTVWGLSREVAWPSG